MQDLLLGVATESTVIPATDNTDVTGASLSLCNPPSVLSVPSVAE